MSITHSDDMEREERIELLFQNTQALMRAWRIYFYKVLSPGNISPAQLMLLIHLGIEGPLSGRDVSEMLHLSPSATAQLLSGLAKRGYVAKEPSSKDKRVTYFKLSGAGMEKWKSIDKKRTQFFKNVAAALSNEEIDTMIATERKIVEQVQKYTVE